MRNTLLTLTAALAIGCWGSCVAAQAAVLVVGEGPAHDCYVAAHQVVQQKVPSWGAIQLCTEAIDSQPLSAHDLAGTYNNRGVLYSAMGAYDAAARDFDAAISNLPQLGESHANRGAALLMMGQFAKAIGEIDKALALNTEAPERSYFNRALAEEELHDQRSAYQDYVKSAALKPGWDMPRREMARFTVVQRTNS